MSNLGDFEKIPPELREMIWGYALLSPTGYVQPIFCNRFYAPSSTSPPGSGLRYRLRATTPSDLSLEHPRFCTDDILDWCYISEEVNTCNRYRYLSNFTSLLRTSRKIYSEAAPMFWETNTFLFGNAYMHLLPNSDFKIDAVDIPFEKFVSLTVLMNQWTTFSQLQDLCQMLPNPYSNLTPNSNPITNTNTSITSNPNAAVETKSSIFSLKRLDIAMSTTLLSILYGFKFGIHGTSTTWYIGPDRSEHNSAVLSKSYRLKLKQHYDRMLERLSEAKSLTPNVERRITVFEETHQQDNLWRQVMTKKIYDIHDEEVERCDEIVKEVHTAFGGTLIWKGKKLWEDEKRFGTLLDLGY